jgi:hypothetical protein
LESKGKKEEFSISRGENGLNKHYKQNNAETQNIHNGGVDNKNNVSNE